MSRIVHPIPPLFDRLSRVLILGTIPSPKSREAGFYYMHPRNRFWLTLATLWGEPLPAADATARASFALCHHIALWDVLHACEIEGAADATICSPQPNDLSPILQVANIQAIFTTGIKSTELYKKYIFPTSKISSIPLPSTSPANCALSLAALCEAYRVILPYLEETQ